ELTWHNLKKYLPRLSGKRVLDLGGGTGYWALRLAKSGYEVALVDISQQMIEAARRKAEQAGLSNRITFLKSDISDSAHDGIGLPSFPPAHFDLAIAQGDSLSCCANPPRAVKEVARVLKKDGLFIASVDNKFGGLRVFIEQNKIEELEKLVRTGQTHWFTKEKTEQFPLTYFTPDELRKLFIAHGFEVISLIGKPVLPLRPDSRLLENKETFKQLFQLELQLQSEECLLGSAPHLEIAVRKKQ
ncbi:MAG: class I SAM-dependent methyltransferase, partial [Planctomycetota bacterium]